MDDPKLIEEIREWAKYDRRKKQKTVNRLSLVIKKKTARKLRELSEIKKHSSLSMTAIWIIEKYLFDPSPFKPKKNNKKK